MSQVTHSPAAQSSLQPRLTLHRCCIMVNPTIPWGWAHPCSHSCETSVKLLETPSLSSLFPWGSFQPDLRLLCFKGRNALGSYCVELMWGFQEASVGTGGAGL